MISNSLAYALKAIIFIALNSSEDKRIRIKDLKESMNVPEAYVAKLLQELVRNNILKSVKGPNGGFYLTEKEMDLHLMKIVTTLEGTDSYTRCVISLGNCNDNHPCPLHNNIGQVRVELVKKFQNLTIRDLANDVKAGNSFIS